MNNYYLAKKRRLNMPLIQLLSQQLHIQFAASLVMSRQLTGQPISNAAYRQQITTSLRELAVITQNTRSKSILNRAREEIESYRQHCGGNIGYRTVSYSRERFNYESLTRDDRLRRPNSISPDPRKKKGGKITQNQSLRGFDGSINRQKADQIVRQKLDVSTSQINHDIVNLGIKEQSYNIDNSRYIKEQQRDPTEQIAKLQEKLNLQKENMIQAMQDLEQVRKENERLTNDRANLLSQIQNLRESSEHAQAEHRNQTDQQNRLLQERQLQIKNLRESSEHAQAEHRNQTDYQNRLLQERQLQIKNLREQSENAFSQSLGIIHILQQVLQKQRKESSQIRDQLLAAKKLISQLNQEDTTSFQRKLNFNNNYTSSRDLLR